MLIYFEPATMCDLNSGLVIAPLPGKRQLWQASDEHAWKAECERDPEYQIRYALSSDGDLVKLDQETVQPTSSDMVQHHGQWHYNQWNDRPTTTRTVVDWKEWCSGMDDFGGLVMLAASFLA